jgi:hypothetical protein
VVPTTVPEASRNVTVEPTSPVPDTVFDPVAGVSATDGIVDLVSMRARTGAETDAPPWVRVAPLVTQKVSGLRGALGATIVENVNIIMPGGNTTVLGRVHAAWRFPSVNVHRAAVLYGVKVYDVSPAASIPTYRVLPGPLSKMVFGGATIVTVMPAIAAPVPRLAQYAWVRPTLPATDVPPAPGPSPDWAPEPGGPTDTTSAMVDADAGATPTVSMPTIGIAAAIVKQARRLRGFLVARHR